MIKIYKKQNLVDADRLAEILHSAGIDAYGGYERMGMSASHWNSFRKSIAYNLLKEVDIYPKKKSNVM